ncbi:MAG: hypothetical protein IPP72_03020 [Chitinophagaceae bacterium]|nr:hypothetical protein [Chitinophagaceae bacterium]
MKKIFIAPLIFMTCLTLMSPIDAKAQQTGLAKNEITGYKERVRNVDIKHIALDLRFDWSKKKHMEQPLLPFYHLQKLQTEFHWMLGC